ncbi:MAG: FISUMP domain-containing protein [Bacteroidales bacterium]
MSLQIRKNILIPGLLSLLSISALHSQTTITLTFTANAGGIHQPLDSIYVKNLTQDSDTMLYGNDTVLVLDHGIGIQEWGVEEPELISDAYPNPFIESTTFHVSVSKKDMVTIRIFDPAGREVTKYQENLAPGSHSFRFVPGSGTSHFLVAETSQQKQSIKLVNTGKGEGNARIEAIGYQSLPSGLKLAIAGFPWAPGDDLVLVGIGEAGAGMVGFDAAEDNPSQSKTYTFGLLHGVPCLEYPLVTDADGNHYRGIRIGTQCWMQENLKTTRFDNGASIAKVTDGTAWIGLTTPAYCWYLNDSASYAAVYGPLYNWYAAGAVNLCPSGWHVPTDAEWTVLIDHLGGSNIAGNKLKESGLLHWNSPNTGATNESAFTARPGGFREGTDGNYYLMGNNGRYWSSTASSIANGWLRELNNSNGIVYRNNYTKKNGYSVRCIKD